MYIIFISALNIILARDKYPSKYFVRNNLNKTNSFQSTASEISVLEIKKNCASSIYINSAYFALVPLSWFLRVLFDNF